MSLYEDWMKKAFSQEGRSIEAVWEEYLPKEQKRLWQRTQRFASILILRSCIS